ncbi:MAG: two-component system, NtrC family, response regulator AtoC [Acidobacteriota bacterium]|nr:two-component system, NtrC family, response regulator AtoC [Acidobacteriota bacterium]
MNLVSELVRQISNPSLPRDQRAELRCHLAKELEEAGNYDEAGAAFGEIWESVGERPRVDGLEPRVAGEVLMRVGALTGWIGSANQLADAQEIAKDLISESVSQFESIDDIAKVAEARTELAYCYWREGAFDEARVTLHAALSYLTEEHSEVKAVALLRSAIVDISAQRFNDALRILTEIQPLYDEVKSHSFKGRFHIALANTLKNLGTTERRGDYIDRALIEYAAASHHFEMAGHTSYRAAVENNSGFLLFKEGKFDEAIAHLESARRLFTSLKDKVHSAQVDETRARVLLAQKLNLEAEKVIRSAVLTLEKGGEHALLAEALTTHGLALSRLGQREHSRTVLTRAMEVAEQAGDPEGAGRAALTLIEELRDRLTEEEASHIYRHADELLAGSQHIATILRLRDCARHVLDLNKTSTRDEATTTFVYAAENTAALLQQARRLSEIDRPVLITGEPGTGKEVLATLIHEWSGRGGKFVAINCAALTDTRIESQLFGHKKGSFTDAVEDYPGAVREAAGGTLFLDEVAELNTPNQVNLLRLIERGEIYPIGATAPERINVRVITATNRNLADRVSTGKFRQDLFYRLQTFHLDVPPLRERAEDIPSIAEHFIAEACERHHKRVIFHPDSLAAMKELPLPGNARELRILIERTLLKAADGAEIAPGAIETVALRQTREAGFAEVWEGFSLVEEVLRFEKGLILRALNATQGGVTRAARLLGVTHQTLSFILNTRHKDLLSVRKPVTRRRRSIIRPEFARARKQQ